MSVGVDDMMVGLCAIVCKVDGAFGDTEEILNGDDGNAAMTGIFDG